MDLTQIGGILSIISGIAIAYETVRRLRAQKEKDISDAANQIAQTSISLWTSLKERLNEVELSLTEEIKEKKSLQETFALEVKTLQGALENQVKITEGLIIELPVMRLKMEELIQENKKLILVVKGLEDTVKDLRLLIQSLVEQLQKAGVVPDVSVEQEEIIKDIKKEK